MLNKFLRQQSTSGFTLTEVIVVIAMIAVLFGIAAPSWIALLNRQRASSSRDQVLQALQQAKAESVRSKRDYSVIFDGSTNPLSVIVRPTTQTTGGDRQQIGNGRLTPTMINVRAANAANANITRVDFDAFGNIKDPAGTVLPIVVTVTAPANAGVKRCLVVQTILGAMRAVDQGQPNCT